jgi:hypothetical protein
MGAQINIPGASGKLAERPTPVRPPLHLPSARLVRGEGDASPWSPPPPCRGSHEAVMPGRLYTRVRQRLCRSFHHHIGR